MGRLQCHVVLMRRLMMYLKDCHRNDHSRESTWTYLAALSELAVGIHEETTCGVARRLAVASATHRLQPSPLSSEFGYELQNSSVLLSSPPMLAWPSAYLATFSRLGRAQVQLSSELPGPETAVFMCQAPCAPIQKRHTKTDLHRKTLRNAKALNRPGRARTVREHPAERRRERERPVGELKLGVAFCHLPPREQQPLIHYSKVPW